MKRQAGRLHLAASIEEATPGIAVRVTETFLERHPDWVARYGARARKYGIEDATFHLRFLAGAVVADSPASFQDYVRWTARMLGKRGIAAEFLIENLEDIREALREHLAQDAETLEPIWDAALRPDFPEPPPPGEEDVALQRPHSLTRNLYTQAILKGDRTGALNVILEVLESGTPPVDLYAEVLQEALYRVGGLWEANEITVAQEHMATAITQNVMASLYPRLKRNPVRLGKMVLTGTEGELHQVGAMMLADVLEADGWDVCFLGADVPLDGIVKCVEEHQPQVLGISTMMLFNVPRVSELVGACRALPDNGKLRVIVGGGAFRHAPQLYREVGADAFAPDLHAACAVMRQWSGTPS